MSAGQPERVARITEKFYSLLTRVEGLIGKLPPDRRAEPPHEHFDRMKELAQNLRGGAPAHFANFIRNRDFFVGIDRHDPKGIEKFFHQLPNQPEESLVEIEEWLDETSAGVEKCVSRPIKEDIIPPPDE